jgi:hypothetical protein
MVHNHLFTLNIMSNVELDPRLKALLIGKKVVNVTNDSIVLEDYGSIYLEENEREHWNQTIVEAENKTTKP